MLAARKNSRAILEEGLRTLFTPSSFLIIVLAIVLPIGGVIIAEFLGGTYGHFGFYLLGGIVGGVITAIIFIVRQDQLAAVFILAVHLYVDFYAGLYVIALIMALALLVILF